MNKPKTITIRVAVPSWARWIAMDKNGEIFCYAEKPEIGVGTGKWFPVMGRWQDLYSISQKPRDWRKTIRKIK